MIEDGNEGEEDENDWVCKADCSDPITLQRKRCQVTLIPANWGHPLLMILSDLGIGWMSLMRNLKQNENIFSNTRVLGTSL